MEEDKSKKILHEIELLLKSTKIEALHESACDQIPQKINELVASYEEQKRRDAKTIKNQAYFIKQIDKRTININATSQRKDALLAQQSKMAAMGEMMDAVAHQWKQPLNSLSMMNDMLMDDFKNDLVDEAYIQDVTEMTHMQIEHMINTLNEFRTFFRPSKDAQDFSVSECLESVQVLMKDELLKNTISVNVDIQEDITLHGQVNEFKHLFLNLISNAIDAFNEKAIQNRTIEIKTFQNDHHGIIEFEDNAGGIPQHVINSIFKPNVTTKADGKGTGIGLYMSSQIVQKHNGSISVENANDGALFRISIKS
ncbi:sensor histidine kinase [Sulfurimonas paralvinellae]|uniref:histidine kinase n=1 Tax=Sulfurimonas paralvinellae TaxID=317658 RepID=A0A7M1B9M2_9BACT|nr:HAMP domain-containing sensor histidine kinase [Sulfurimonas paralvinellae]QOP46404.1 HAMP domain-containing histidine kinase [Sulfurimonas paralvinellae]